MMRTKHGNDKDGAWIHLTMNNPEGKRILKPMSSQPSHRDHISSEQNLQKYVNNSPVKRGSHQVAHKHSIINAVAHKNDIHRIINNVRNKNKAALTDTKNTIVVNKGIYYAQNDRIELDEDDLESHNTSVMEPSIQIHSPPFEKPILKHVNSDNSQTELQKLIAHKKKTIGKA